MYVYANGTESSEGPENTDSESEWAQQKSACILNVLIRALHKQILVESKKYGVYKCFDHSCFDSYNICPLVNF